MPCQKQRIIITELFVKLFERKHVTVAVDAEAEGASQTEVAVNS